jgi:hypothetical protein
MKWTLGADIDLTAIQVFRKRFARLTRSRLRIADSPKRVYARVSGAKAD